MYVFIYICVYVYICIHTRIYICIHMALCAAPRHTCDKALAAVHMCTYLYNIYTFVYSEIYMYISIYK